MSKYNFTAKRTNSSGSQCKFIRCDPKRFKSLGTSFSNIRWLSLIGLITVSFLYQIQVSTALKNSDGSQSERSATGRPDKKDQVHKATSGDEVPANHRMDEFGEINLVSDQQKARHGRQYDSPMSTSSTGNYAAVSGDSGAYVGGANINPMNGAYSSAAATSNGALPSYVADQLGSNMYSPSAGAYHDQLSYAARMGHQGMHTPGNYPVPSYSANPMASMFSHNSGQPGGLFSSSGFPMLVAKGFDVAEIVCTAIAVAIGAVIVGAPFILLYLFVMNQMQGNGGGAMNPSGGAISLTGPSSSTTVNGRKKRHTSLPEALFKQLSPLVNNEQVAQSFKVLMNSLAKYQT